MPAPPGVLCAKCGAAAAALVPKCARCGGANVRVCAVCGQQNSLGKGFCDKCGRPVSAIRGLPPVPDPSSSSLPAARVSGTIYEDKPVSAAPPPKPLPPPPPPSAAKIFARKALNAAAATLGVLGAATTLGYWHQSRRPEVMAPRVARQYLAALQARDYARAYGFFSTESRRTCTLDEFSASRGTAAWTWSDLRIGYLERGAALISYKLKVEGAAPRLDHVLFVEEPGRGWVRPYNWALMQKVERAFDKGDADMGLLLAQTAAAVNARDPMARGYLCEAAYYRKAPEETVEQCVAAIALARIYPSTLTLKSLYHLHAILADTYKNALARPERALDQFGQMLAFPNISPMDQCEILLARAEAYVTLSRPGEALADLERGKLLCARSEDHSYINTLLKRISAPN